LWLKQHTSDQDSVYQPLKKKKKLQNKPLNVIVQSYKRMSGEDRPPTPIPKRTFTFGGRPKFTPFKFDVSPVSSPVREKSQVLSRNKYDKQYKKIFIVGLVIITYLALMYIYLANSKSPRDEGGMIEFGEPNAFTNYPPRSGTLPVGPMLVRNPSSHSIRHLRHLRGNDSYIRLPIEP
jgi:hypothetical protein